ncbi:SDR family NAD(P)-dependent oxidoreductase [Kitasatospora sp. NPDC089509]|uniref:SDR family NAD(P)-dependent oxidoreductase n=1 Tax=Kitasatospora sp. NPDC089509 TaxID=3364079 RepID=UPI00381C5568
MTPLPEDAVAVVGMAARVPGADTVQELWDNVLAHRASVTRSTDGPHLYARGQLDDVDLFDPAFFGMSPREALTCDPQQRLLLECAWKALADADAGRPQNTAVRERTAVFCGTNHSGYRDLLARSGPVSALEFEAGTAQDFAATRLAYRLGLRGPCVAVQTACSSSLVAVHLACQALLLREADQALAGGASIVLPQSPGWQYESASIHSASGVCRPFDAAADGTVMGDGAALVALRRLEDAVADGARIYAVIRGSAVTNDGGRSNGFTAPSGSGQAEVIRAALARAGLDGGQIGYVETHGTGTALGDQVELQALAEVFASHPDPGGVTLGSAKGAVGHLDIAAGVIGLIRASLALHHAVLLGTVNHTTPSPALTSGAAPLRVLTRPEPWASAEGVRRAGVSSFGVGGTNAHIVLEEPPPSGSAPEPCPATLRDAGYRPRRIWPDPVTAESISTAEPARDQVEFRCSSWSQWAGHPGAEAPSWARVVLMAEQDHTGRRLFDLLSTTVPEGTPVTWAPNGLAEEQPGRTLVVCGYALGAGSQPARRAYDALAAVAASTAGWSSACGVDVVLLTRRAHPVLGTEGGDPRAATLTGLARALSMDVPAVRARTLDLDGTQPWALAEAVRRSVDWAAEPVLALRGRRWWSPTYTRVPEPEPNPVGGVSVVVGVGQIGTVAARVLAATGGTLVLAARPGLGLHNAHRLADDLAALPARIVVRECDAADPLALTALIAQVTRELGRIDRVVMAAGISGEAAYQDSTHLPLWDDEQHFVLKIDAAATLRAAAASHNVRRVVLMSSLAGVLGAIGLPAYSAASAATDSYALHAEHARTRWLSIGWDAWQHQDATASAHEQRMVQDGLTPREAEQALTRLLLSDQSGHILVAMGESFSGRYERYVRAPLSTTHSTEPPVPATGPRSDLLTTLLDAWRSGLADPGLGPDDDLAARGADSLTAIDVLARVGAQTGRVLPTELYFAASSVRGLAAAIDATPATGQRPRTAAVRSWGEGGRSTLWCMHPISGSADVFAALADRLGGSHHVHALTGPPLADVTGEIPIEDLARHHHERLSASAPSPDVVLGFSFGSHLALAVAQLVHDTTGHAPTVVVLDMPAPAGPGPRSIAQVPAAEIVAAITSHRAREAGRRLAIDPDHLRHDPPEQALAHLLDELRAQQIVPRAFTTDLATRLAVGYRHRLAAAERYRPRPYPGRIVVVRAAEPEYDDLLVGVLPAPVDDPSWGWAALAQHGHAVHVLDAHHTTLLQHPSVADIVHRNARPEGPST